MHLTQLNTLNSQSKMYKLLLQLNKPQRSTVTHLHSGKHDNIYNTVMPNVIKHNSDTYLLTAVEFTNQVQASHEPPSLIPHSSSAQQWVTPELGPSSTPRQGIIGQAGVIGKTVIHNHQEEISPRNLPRSLPADPHSPHAYSTPGECTFSVTWTVLRLPVSLTLGYRNRPD